MYIRRIKQLASDGSSRSYAQIVTSFRRPDGTPTNRILAHLGRVDDLLFENLQLAFAAARRGKRLVETESQTPLPDIGIDRNLLYAPLAVVSAFFRDFGLHSLLHDLCPPGERRVPTSTVVEALIAQRCIAPNSKLAFQSWLPQVACEEVFGVPAAAMNNTRVHRALDDLAEVDAPLQERLAASVVAHTGRPRVLYLDLTDTWFEAGGGSLARRGQTKAGHRCKLKIHIALMVDSRGLPLRWELLPGALSETTVLPRWLPPIHRTEAYADAFLVFDRGLPSVANFERLLDPHTGHRFLTSVKSDSIPTYLPLDPAPFDALQALPDEAPPAALAQACAALELAPALDGLTCRRDLGVVQPPKPSNRSQHRPPPMHLWLYFNPEIWRTKRQARAERMRQVQAFVQALNQELRAAKRSRKPEPLRAQVSETLRRHKLLELYEIRLDPLPLGTVGSFQVRLELRPVMLRNMQRFDGMTLLVAHPELPLSADEAIGAYRQKNAVEADFRTIKSVLDLRPTYHWANAKIQAHVTLCVLALLVERLIEERLTAPLKLTAPAALARLAPLQLNRVRVGQERRVLMTQSDPETRRLLQRLGCPQVLNRYPTSLQASPTAIPTT